MFTKFSSPFPFNPVSVNRTTWWCSLSWHQDEIQSLFILVGLINNLTALLQVTFCTSELFQSSLLLFPHCMNIYFGLPRWLRCSRTIYKEEFMPWQDVPTGLFFLHARLRAKISTQINERSNWEPPVFPQHSSLCWNCGEGDGGVTSAKVRGCARRNPKARPSLPNSHSTKEFRAPEQLKCGKMRGGTPIKIPFVTAHPWKCPKPGWTGIGDLGW